MDRSLRQSKFLAVSSCALLELVVGFMGLLNDVHGERLVLWLHSDNLAPQ